MMIIFVYFLPNMSGLVCAKNLRKWAEKAFASSTLLFHGRNYCKGLFTLLFGQAVRVFCNELRVSLHFINVKNVTSKVYQKS
jgi:hypothetical protein